MMSILAVSLLFASHSGAELENSVQLLPPWHQEAREKESIMNDPRLIENLKDEDVLEIQKIPGGYLVLTEQSEMEVSVCYLPMKNGMVGPANFELVFHQPKPRSSGI